MMKRRDFVKTTAAAGSAFLLTSGAFAFSCSQSKRKISINDDIQKALDSVAPGDTIVLKDGIYYQNLIITRGGTPGKPVTLKAANGGGATLSGAMRREEVKNIRFEQVEGDLYKAAVPHRVWWVMVGPRNLVNYGKLDLLRKFLFPDQSNGELKQCVPEGFAWKTAPCTFAWRIRPTPTLRPSRSAVSPEATRLPSRSSPRKTAGLRIPASRSPVWGTCTLRPSASSP